MYCEFPSDRRIRIFFYTCNNVVWTNWSRRFIVVKEGNRDEWTHVKIFESSVSAKVTFLWKRIRRKLHFHRKHRKNRAIPYNLALYTEFRSAIVRYIHRVFLNLFLWRNIAINTQFYIRTWPPCIWYYIVQYMDWAWTEALLTMGGMGHLRNFKVIPFSPLYKRTLYVNIRILWKELLL